MGKLRLTSYQSIVRVEDIPDPQRKDILQLLLDHLSLVIVRESTPDYVGYEIRAAPSESKGAVVPEEL